MRTLSDSQRLLVIAIPTIVALAVLAWLPPLPQPLAYHDFADRRVLLGFANGMDVASNLPFLLVGVLGVGWLADHECARRAFDDPAERWPYLLFFAAVALTSAGSGYYHLAPDNARLVWDRLPMTVAFMSLLTATVVDRISVHVGLRLLLPLVLVGIASVAWWRWSAHLGAEDLGPYLAVQFGSIATLAFISLSYPSRHRRGADIAWVFSLYALAKVAEELDGWLYQFGGLVSGHSLKHVVAALACLFVLRMLVLRARGRLAGDSRS